MTIAATSAATPRPALLLLVLLLLRFGIQQGLTVADGDLIIVGMDFGEGQKSVPVAAVVDKRRLQRGFDPGYLREIDIATQLSLVGGFEIEFLNPAAAQNDDPGFFRVRRVDKHLVGHYGLVGACVGAGAKARPRHRSKRGERTVVPRGTTGI